MNNFFPVLSGGSGAAFLLDVPAKTTLTLHFPEGLVSIRKDAAFATVSLISRLSQEEAKDHAWRVLQEALDVIAARRQATLQTAEGDCTFLVWFKNGVGYELVVVNTIDAPWSMSVNIRIEGTAPAVIAPPQPLPPRHPALRFYRLANASADLFNAFRNAYLAMECLVSDATPKGASESELNWLKRAISGSLLAGLPTGVIDDGAIEDIYMHGRLPTFHAKIGRTFYSPHDRERESMQVRFDRLMLLVNCLLQNRFGHDFVSRGASMSQGLYDSMALASFTFDEIVLKDGALLASLPANVETVSSPRRFNQLWCRTTIARPSNLDWIDSIETRKAGVIWTSSVFDERLPLQGVNMITLEINLLQYNNRSKRPVHRL